MDLQLFQTHVLLDLRSSMIRLADGAVDETGNLFDQLIKQVDSLMRPWQEDVRKKDKEEKAEALEKLYELGPLEVESAAPPTRDRALQAAFGRIRSKLRQENKKA